MEPLRSQLFLCQEEGWQTPTCTGLSPAQQMDQEESKRIPTHSIRSRQTRRMHSVRQVRYPMGLQQYPHQAG